MYKLLFLLVPFIFIGSIKKTKSEKINTETKIPLVTKKYIDRFYKVAQYEHKKFGIPASITLAQGILESASGQSYLTKQTNNHFGIKCVVNCNDYNSVMMKDDKPTDRFLKYKSAWYSYRHHSQLLMKPRYKPCRDCKNDYRCWAINLKKCGYATSKKYHRSLIDIIEKYDLTRFD